MSRVEWEGSALAVEPHVFVTADGRARRTTRWLGRLVAVALAAWLIAVVVGGSGFASLPLLRIAHARESSSPVFVKYTLDRRHVDSHRS
jgi:hypothetical protein